jgi:hypothetical protein
MKERAMDWHLLWVVLLVLPFPIWAWVFGRLFFRLRTPRRFMLAGLVSVALAVGFSVAFSRWLEEPQFARAAALIYGCPAAFFFLFATFGWFAQHYSISPSTFEDRTSTERGEDKGEEKGTS